MRNWAFIILALWLSTVQHISAQDLPPCNDREFISRPVAGEVLPHTYYMLWCIERPVYEPDFGELSFTSMTLDDEDILYATVPYQGAVYVLRDSNGDSMPDSPQILVDGLNKPNALTYADDTLYIATDGAIYQYHNDELSLLVDDLPSGQGFWIHGLLVHDDRLYVGVPMPCDFCESDNPLHGTVLSFALDGSDRQIIARGLRYPAALIVYDGALLVTDTARDDRYNTPMLDELNRIDLASDTVPHFGFPYCIGRDNTPDMAGDFNCADATAPYLTFRTQSTPFALLHYDYEYTYLYDNLLLVQAGALHSAEVRGYTVLTLEFDDPEGRIEIEPMLPSDPDLSAAPRLALDPADGLYSAHAQFINERGFGTYPHRIFDVVMSAEGWLYISAGGGSIYALRFGDYDPCDYLAACD